MRASRSFACSFVAFWNCIFFLLSALFSNQGCFVISIRSTQYAQADILLQARALAASFPAFADILALLLQTPL